MDFPVLSDCSHMGGSCTDRIVCSKKLRVFEVRVHVIFLWLELMERPYDRCDGRWYIYSKG